MIQLVKYVRVGVGYTVWGIQVTDRNMVEVASWCEGKLAQTRDDRKQDYISVPILGKNDRVRKAFAGSWILLSDQKKFMLYQHGKFEVKFEKAVYRDKEFETWTYLAPYSS